MQSNIDQNHVLQLRQRLGAVVKEKRIQAGMEQKELGEAVGIAASSISKIESGKYSTQIDMFIKLGVVLNFKVDFI